MYIKFTIIPDNTDYFVCQVFCAGVMRPLSLVRLECAKDTAPNCEQKKNLKHWRWKIDGTNFQWAGSFPSSVCRLGGDNSMFDISFQKHVLVDLFS